MRPIPIRSEATAIAIGWFGRGHHSHLIRAVLNRRPSNVSFSSEMALPSPVPTLISLPPRHRLLLPYSRCAGFSENGRWALRKEVLRCTATRGDIDGRTFVDEDGVVKDMDAYLNHLSLEYESVWDTKPSWCQPWTILLSGVSVIAFSWLTVHSLAFSSAVACLICVWWYIFLYSYPKAYEDMIAERKRKVSSGAEDTFGNEKRR